MPDTPVASPRVVPGAPPPVSKPQKKKRKGGKAKEESEGGSHLTVPDTTTAALIDKAPEEIDLKEGVVAPQLMAQVSEGLLTPARDGKQSPIVDMVSKRLKANNKKIVSDRPASRTVLVCPSRVIRHSCLLAFRVSVMADWCM